MDTTAQNGSPKRLANCDECGAEFAVTHPAKRFCCERHQRRAENRRYRDRHTEPATCPHCGADFERCTTTKRRQVYCTTTCQAKARSIAYTGRKRNP